MADNGAKDAIVVGLVLVLLGIVGLAVWFRNQIAADDAERISDLIDANRANARPGMERRDDELLQRAEERARARRAPYDG